MAKNSEEVVDRKFLLFIFQYIETQRETTAGKDTGPFIVEQFNCQEYKQGEKFLGDWSGTQSAHLDRHRPAWLKTYFEKYECV